MSGPSSTDEMSAMPFQAPEKTYRAAYLAPAVTASWLPGASVLVNELDCSLGTGASYALPDLPEPVPLAECFQRCKEDHKCDAIRVDWWPVQQNWSARHIGCGLRGGIANVSKCAKAPHHNNSINIRYSMFAIDASDKSQLAVAISMLAGYRTEPQHLWSAGPKPGDSGGWLPALLMAAKTEPALSLPALRIPVPVTSGVHYGMLRYDALGTGQAALVAVNLGAAQATVHLDLRGLPPHLLGQHSTNLCKDLATCSAVAPVLSNNTRIDVAGRGYAALVGLRLPRW